MPKLMESMPEDNICRDAWRDHGEIVYVKNEDRETLCKLSDHYAAEHTEVHCADLPFFQSRLKNYGSLFLGEETCVTYGDKISGTNHALPTLRAARYTGGLSVDKYIKKLTYQKMDKGESQAKLGPMAARISRA